MPARGMKQNWEGLQFKPTLLTNALRCNACWHCLLLMASPFQVLQFCRIALKLPSCRPDSQDGCLIFSPTRDSTLFCKSSGVIASDGSSLLYLFVFPTAERCGTVCAALRSCLRRRGEGSVSSPIISSFHLRVSFICSSACLRLRRTCMHVCMCVWNNRRPAPLPTAPSIAPLLFWRGLWGLWSTGL